MRSLVLSFLAISALIVGCAGSTEDSATASGAAQTSGATKTLLDCNVFEGGGGPDQQVTVLQKHDGSLVLRELTEDGATVERALGEDEWKSGDLELRKDDLDGPEAVNRLYKDASGRWMDQAKSDGFDTEGTADCRSRHASDGNNDQ